VREKAWTSKCGGATLDPVLKLQPPPHLSRECFDVKDVVFPSRLVRAVQEEVVGVAKRGVRDQREWGLEDHRHGGRRWGEKEKAESHRPELQKGRFMHGVALTQKTGSLPPTEI
jgi:hypothetical protein